MSEQNSKDRASLCDFTWSDGRQCRSLRHSTKSKYCLPHDRELRNLKEADSIAADLVEPISGDFVPATALTHSLARLFQLLAEGRVDPKTATALASVANTLLKSIGKSNEEFQQCYLEGYWRQLVRTHFNDLPNYIPPVPRDQRPTPKPTDNSTTGDESGNSGPSDRFNSQDSQPFKPRNPELPKTIDEFLKKVGIAAG